mmetsp:Transcript_16364/g.37850  ORF Transcript_16364/g.37850 Transcript_16364/m.37850 type:complete len:291 (+) Transcript_16364:45-917(+)
MTSSSTAAAAVPSASRSRRSAAPLLPRRQPRCGPAILCRLTAYQSGPRGADRTCGAAATPSTTTWQSGGARSLTRSETDPTSRTRPRTFEQCDTATTLVRPLIRSERTVESPKEGGSDPTPIARSESLHHRTLARHSAASSSHGATLAAWFSDETTTSSPSPTSPARRTFSARRPSSDVALGPRIASRPPSSSSSRPSSPPRSEDDRARRADRRHAAPRVDRSLLRSDEETASATARGTWAPPPDSKKISRGWFIGRPVRRRRAFPRRPPRTFRTRAGGAARTRPTSSCS